MDAKNTKEYLARWNRFKEITLVSTGIDKTETDKQKAERIARLDKSPEAWFKYYFPHYYLSEPAPFHIEATKRVLSNPEWFEVRSWSRELAKSARTMMEVLYLSLTGKKRNWLLVSATYDNAERLLLPYKVELECNQKIINDYGLQQGDANWTSGEFKTRSGVAFRALGKGQSPRGTRNEAYRPDGIIIDDFDTDEECRNKKRIKASLDWIEQALLPTRSISGSLLIIVCGNIIAKYCCVSELGKKADKHDIVNIRDKNGKSSWPQKNSEENIDRVLKQISFNSAQKEYFNNPVVEGGVFKELHYGNCPPIASCSQVVVYADPSTSNKDKGTGSHKGVGVIGMKGGCYFLYKIWLDTMSNANFVEALFEAHKYLVDNKVDTKRMYLENNTLQDPFYEQVLLPLIRQYAKSYNIALPITPDTRKKPEKFFRIEGTLEPLNRLGTLIFNIKEKESPHMIRMHDQMIGVEPDAKLMDGPDLLEGGVWIIQNKLTREAATYHVGTRSNRKY